MGGERERAVVRSSSRKDGDGLAMADSVERVPSFNPIAQNLLGKLVLVSSRHCLKFLSAFLEAFHFRTVLLSDRRKGTHLRENFCRISEFVCLGKGSQVEEILRIHCARHIDVEL